MAYYKGMLADSTANKILRLLLYALLAMPLLLWSIFLFPFITTKILYFRLLVEAAFGIYIILALRNPELRPRRSPVFWAVWIYVAAILVAALFGVNFAKSFWGTIERGEGIVTIIHFALYFTMLSAVLKTRGQWYNYLFAAVVSTALSALYGLGQLFNLSFLVNTNGSRVSSTIGNAAFFAAYMIFGIFLSLYLLSEGRQQAKPKWQSVFLWSVFCLELVVMFESQTRGAVIASAVAFALYALYGLFRSGERRVKMVLGALLAILVVGTAAIYLGRDAKWIKTNHTIQRLASISASDTTTQSRLDTWRASWEGWHDRLFFGYGYENYNVAFNKYFPSRIFKKQGSQLWFDRAHNIIFDQGATSGIFGIAAYLGMLGAAAWALLRHPNRGKVILFLLLVAYFLQNLFVFDTQATYLMFYLLLAHIAFLRADGGFERSYQEGKIYRTGYFGAGAAVIVVLLVAYVANIKPALANYYTTLGIRHAQAHEYRDVKGYFEKALSYNTYMNEEIAQRMVDYSNESARSGILSQQEQLDFYQYNIDELQKVIAGSPQDARDYLYLVSLMNRAYPLDHSLADQVLALTNKAIELSPTRQQVYFEQGQAYFYKGDYERGLAAFQKAIDLYYPPMESHFNMLLGSIIAKRPPITEREIKALGDLGYAPTVDQWSAIGMAYSQAGDKAKVIESYREVVKLSPDSAEAHAKLAVAYGDVCDLKAAKAEVDIILEIDPSFTGDAQTFLQETQAKCKGK